MLDQYRSNYTYHSFKSVKLKSSFTVARTSGRRGWGEQLTLVQAFLRCGIDSDIKDGIFPPGTSPTRPGLSFSVAHVRRSKPATAADVRAARSVLRRYKSGPSEGRMGSS